MFARSHRPVGLKHLPQPRAVSYHGNTASFAVLGHVWTAPTGQGILLVFSLRSGASHVSGLFARCL